MGFDWQAPELPANKKPALKMETFYKDNNWQTYVFAS